MYNLKTSCYVTLNSLNKLSIGLLVINIEYKKYLFIVQAPLNFVSCFLLICLCVDKFSNKYKKYKGLLTLA